MRKWKDDGSSFIKPLQRKLYFIIGCLIAARPLIFFLIGSDVTIFDIINGGLGILLIWGVNFNGFYKLARRYMEWRLKHKDNRFDYYSR